MLRKLRKFEHPPLCKLHHLLMKIMCLKVPEQLLNRPRGEDCFHVSSSTFGHVGGAVLHMEMVKSCKSLLQFWQTSIFSEAMPFAVAKVIGEASSYSCRQANRQPVVYSNMSLWTKTEDWLNSDIYSHFCTVIIIVSIILIECLSSASLC